MFIITAPSPPAQYSFISSNLFSSSFETGETLLREDRKQSGAWCWDCSWLKTWVKTGVSWLVSCFSKTWNTVRSDCLYAALLAFWISLEEKNRSWIKEPYFEAVWRESHFGELSREMNSLRSQTLAVGLPEDLIRDFWNGKEIYCNTTSWPLH